MTYTDSLDVLDRPGSSQLERLKNLYWLVEHEPESPLAEYWRHEIDRIRAAL